VRTKRRRKPKARKVLDGRSALARRTKVLAEQFEAEAGGDLSPGRKLAIRRAAGIVALAEVTRLRRLAGDPNTSIDDVVRVERLAARALRDCGLSIEPRPMTRQERAAAAYHAAQLEGAEG
jgi:hypothetical protein